MVENLLAMGRFGPGVKIEVEPVALGVAVSRVSSRAAWRSAHNIVSDIPQDVPPVLAQTFPLEQVLDNLLSNAQKYGSPDASILVSARRRDGYVEVAVQDRGPGVMPGERETIFEPFRRSEATAGQAGIGIGLVVCRRLIEAMDGTLWLDPDYTDGARFCFTLKAAK
jgi:two-component system sensor histidine kinase KdpD